MILNSTLSDYLLILSVIFIMFEFKRSQVCSLDKFQVVIGIFAFLWFVYSTFSAISSAIPLINPLKDFVAFTYLFIGYTLLKVTKFCNLEKLSTLILGLLVVQLGFTLYELPKMIETGYPRAFGSFDNPNLLASWTTSFCLFLLIVSNSRRVKILGIICGLIILILASGIGANLAFFLAMSYFFYFDVAARFPTIWVNIYVLFSTVLSFVVTYLISLTRGNQAIGTSFLERLDIWRGITNAIGSKPLSASEPTVQIPVEPVPSPVEPVPSPVEPVPSPVEPVPSPSPGFQTLKIDAHNDFLSFLSAGGILGGLFYASMVTILLLMTRNRFRAAVILFLLGGLTSSVLTYSWMMLLLGAAIYQSKYNSLASK
jgi:hypothetical protein